MTLLILFKNLGSKKNVVVVWIFISQNKSEIKIVEKLIRVFLLFISEHIENIDFVILEKKKLTLFLNLSSKLRLIFYKFRALLGLLESIIDRFCLFL
jgi:hypothetical protein